MEEAKSTVDRLFEQLMKELASRGEELTKGLKCVVRFDVDGETWVLELHDSTQRLTKGDADLEADVELGATEENFIKIVMGHLSPQTAFMLGKLKMRGDMMTALKLTPILSAARPKAKL